MDIPDLSETWPKLFAELLGQQDVTDAAHDPNHIRRVVTNARRLTLEEGADWTVVMPAAWLHDCVAVPKSSPDRRIASRLCAQQAVEWLEKYDWPYGRLDEVAHAIEAHSFSAAVVPRTLEAKVVQDADRLDALGAVGLARTLMLGAERIRPAPWRGSFRPESRHPGACQPLPKPRLPGGYTPRRRAWKQAIRCAG